VGGIPRIGVAAIAVVLAALALFFIGPMLLGIGNDSPGGGGGAAPTTQPADELQPTAEPTVPPAPTPQTYIVAKGDTMSKIARKFHVTVEQLLAANPKVKDADRIAVGDELTIPVPEDDAGS
jgi:LysM repeat protein